VANKSKRAAKASARGAGVLSGLKTGLIERELCVSAWLVKGGWGLGVEGWKFTWPCVLPKLLSPV